MSHRNAQVPACAGIPLCITNLCNTTTCASSATRYMWDGQQILTEDRFGIDGSGQASDNGIVTYVNGLELDRPVGVLDSRVSGGLRVPHPSWRGMYESSSTGRIAALNYSDPLGLCPPKDQNYNDCDTSRPERDPEFRKKLDEAGRRAEANTWLTLAALGGIKAAITGGLEAIRALVAGGEAAKAAAPAVEVVFGHGARHLAGTGLEAAKVEGVIRAEVTQAVRGASETGTFWGRVVVDGQKLEYRAFTVAAGKINVGTYYPIP